MNELNESMNEIRMTSYRVKIENQKAFISSRLFRHFRNFILITLAVYFL